MRATRSRRHRAHRPTALHPASLHTRSTPWRYPAAYYEQDRLPDDDSLYSPTTPLRVHLASDEHLDGEKPLDVFLPQHHSAVHLASAGDADRDLEAAIDVPDDARQAVNTSIIVMPPAPPPAYGLWRCSVRADPNLLHWVRSPTIAAPASPTGPLISPVTIVALEDDAHIVQSAQETFNPPSYTIVSSPASPVDASASAPAPASVGMPEITPATTKLGDWILPDHMAATRSGATQEVVLDAGDAVIREADGVHEAARRMLREGRSPGGSL